MPKLYYEETKERFTIIDCIICGALIALFCFAIIGTAINLAAIRPLSQRIAELESNQQYWLNVNNLDEINYAYNKAVEHDYRIEKIEKQLQEKKAQNVDWDSCLDTCYPNECGTDCCQKCPEGTPKGRWLQGWSELTKTQKGE